MIKLEKTEVVGWEHAIRGMRNPMNSWKKSDSDYRPILCARCDDCESYHLEKWDDCQTCEVELLVNAAEHGFMVGPNDHELMMKLRNAGTDHRKFMRMIAVYVDITAPLYWWKEFDTYKVGTVANSCSTMHKIHEKEFTIEDFSCEKLLGVPDDLNFNKIPTIDVGTYIDDEHIFTPRGVLEYIIIPMLNKCREFYAKNNHQAYWHQMIQLLPSSYNQKRTIMLNYEVLANIYKSRKNHKLNEWRELCKWIEKLPYSEIITGAQE